MTDDLPERLSTRTGELHTVCIGRPFGLDYLALAQRGIHVHLYGNAVDDLYRMMARNLSLTSARREGSGAPAVPARTPLAPGRDAPWSEVRRVKSTWVREFAQYDAGWSYIGSPFLWEPLDDRGAIPNRVSTYLLAGLPVISDRRPAYYRYDELTRLGVNVDLVDGDWDGLRHTLEAEARSGERRAKALRERTSYSFDALVDPLLAALELARERYWERPIGERTRFATRRIRLVHFAMSPDPRAQLRGLWRSALPPSGARGVRTDSPPRAVGRALREKASRQTARWKARLLARHLREVVGIRPEPFPAQSRPVRGTVPANVAALERFSDPSRRCDPRELAGLGASVTTWDLPHPFQAPLDGLRRLPAAIAGWLAMSGDAGDRWRLFRACLGTGGARIGALLRGPELLGRVHRGEIDALHAYSAKDFGLAHLLASRLDRECRETIGHTTQYFGEFAFELLAVVPYAYWLHSRGLLERTVSTPDTRPLYYFSPNHEERPLLRGYVPITEYPIGRGGPVRYDRKTFPRELNTGRWLPPPYKAIYADSRFRWERELCIVCNKYSDEQYLWYRGPANFIGTRALLALIGRLRTRYQVVYVRPRPVDIVNDHQAIGDPGDIEAVERAYPDVRNIQQLRAEHPDLSYNELQLRLFAGCERFVSVLGGSSYLASWFGGTNIVLAKRGWEVACGAYERWFDRFSGARVRRVRSERELLRAAEQEFLT
jgi:hypothetical protein